METKFVVRTGESKKGKTYYAIVLQIGPVEKFICFITKNEYELLTK